ncbi:protein of unknown function [Candidatus Filomicrobium marinum]|uniref:Uncharacterized protein n=1 Tax=Candidatus Filomicrobium marinum TaxID=1608628 RepID=A0A0D6JK53_9HYPH|nr:hypothetical protein [Candidatus Filomicrobium marinum]CPR22369.1 protein of unknown function [Candidatus Filomicrobium marinum]
MSHLGLTVEQMLRTVTGDATHMLEDKQTRILPWGEIANGVTILTSINKRLLSAFKLIPA